MEKIYLVILDIEVDENDLESIETEKKMSENFHKIDPNLYDRLDRCYYSPSDSYELYDYETDEFYGSDGSAFRDPDEYDINTEGYTPFGDE